MTRTPTLVVPRSPDARQRILECAYELFSRRAVRDVGVDEIVLRSGVAKATLYRHFASKDELVLAFLRLREERWTRDFVEAEARRRGKTGEERLADHVVVSPSQHIPRIQEAQASAYHVLRELVELAGRPR